jgi:MFS family permease
MSSADVGIAGALYIAGACLGALFFGQLTTATGARSSHGHAWRLPARDGPDRVRRRVCAYLGSAALVVVLGILLRNGSLTTTAFMALIMATFFLASAGASSAYLTVSEVFPMETRGLAIALFYAAGTAVGGITGPLLFGNFIHSGNVSLVATGFFIGAAAMALGGIAELLFGVRAEGKSLENIATPLTAEEAEADPRRQGEIQAVRERNRRTEQEHEAARTRSMRILRRAAPRSERSASGRGCAGCGPAPATRSTLLGSSARRGLPAAGTLPRTRSCTASSMRSAVPSMSTGWPSAAPSRGTSAPWGQSRSMSSSGR